MIEDSRQTITTAFRVTIPNLTLSFKRSAFHPVLRYRRWTEQSLVFLIRQGNKWFTSFSCYKMLGDESSAFFPNYRTTAWRDTEKRFCRDYCSVVGFFAKTTAKVVQYNIFYTITWRNNNNIKYNIKKLIWFFGYRN